MVGDLYGRRHFAKIRGNLGFYYMWGGFIGPVAAGWIYDRVETYTPTLWGLVGLYLISAYVYKLLSKPWLARVQGRFAL
jgi:nitrate/nitrite transporter NarK